MENKKRSFEEIIRSMGEQVTSRLFQVGAMSCEKCGHTQQQICFPVYAKNGGLVTSWLIYLCEEMPNKQLKTMALEFGWNASEENIKSKIFHALSEFPASSKTVEEFGDMGRAAPENRIGF